MSCSKCGNHQLEKIAIIDKKLENMHECHPDRRILMKRKQHAIDCYLKNNLKKIK